MCVNKNGLHAIMVFSCVVPNISTKRQIFAIMYVLKMYFNSVS